MYDCKNLKTNYEGHELVYQTLKAQGSKGWDTPEYYKNFKIRVETLLQQVDISKESTFLELGCGAGNMTFWFAEKGYRTYGVDISPTAIAWAKDEAEKRNLLIDFNVGNVLKLEEFSDNFFDVVFDGHCFHCIIGVDRYNLLSEAYRILKPGGYLIINSMCGEVTQVEMLKNFDEKSRCIINENFASRYIGLPESILGEIRDCNFDIIFHHVQNREDERECDDLMVLAAKPI
ncbi:MAG: class I SAM-dependent methyltransferase [Candidatus Cloacimonetes bacterium]|nr:class I SAM-dependent methyltransferase [Candidatus Cloacimonadota bacterium]